MSDQHWSQMMLPRERIEQLENVNRDLRQQLANSEARVAELTGEVAIQNELMQQMVYTESTVNRKTVADSVALAGPTLLLRKQAEAVEEATNEHEIKSATDDSKCYSVALRNYAKRLRQQADEAERAGGEQWTGF